MFYQMLGGRELESTRWLSATALRVGFQSCAVKHFEGFTGLLTVTQLYIPSYNVLVLKTALMFYG